jgi:hypothetical protein
MQKYYVYYHIDPRNNQIRYIGKGKGRRAYLLSGRFGYHKNWLNELKQLGLKPIIQIVEYFDIEQEAFDKERDLIKSEKEINDKLCNLTNGGEGCAGMKWEEIYTSNYIKKKKKECKNICNKNSLNQKGKTLEELYGKEKADELKKQRSHVGKNNPMYGKKRPDLIRFNKKRKGISGLKHSIATKEKISKSNKGKNGKKLLDTNTGVIYNSIIEAAIILNINKYTLLNGIWRKSSKYLNFIILNQNHHPQT